ncbi:hypothetical protein FN846DRAFT_893315 [Sphaerosporella brunnea]|uniref:UBA domain-containing protein n=1 Tax=Sphaerosporella brunnea TaxID=1250544 RepID=A0A5J5EL44_9PEZI|nr:hypothetical protein FN846DRAFT_893315 [Sphaerosporella brunnea]
MDDLSGLNWSSTTKSEPPKPSPANAFSNLSLKPSSVRSVSPAQNGAASKKPPDSFANLVSFGRDKQTSNLSLLEQQKQLEEKRRQDAEESRRKMDALFGVGGGANNGFWDSLYDGKSNTPAAQTSTSNDDEDDILAAFKASAPVDTTSHFPPPSATPQPQNGSTASPLGPFDDVPAPQSNSQLGIGVPSRYKAVSPSSDPFDPFDVVNLPSRDTSPFPVPQTQTQTNDDFDILGDLAKPVSELPPRPTPSPSPKPISPPPASDPRDPAIAEIMDMGFTAEQAKKALAETDTGLDVQAAVSWLLEEAHRNSRPIASHQERPRQSRQDSSRSRTRREPERDDNIPAWAKVGKPGGGEKDLGAIAAEVSGNLFKSANNLWSTGRKKMERAVAEFKADLADQGDPNQPKWMRERQIREELERRGARGISRNDRPPVGDRQERTASKQAPEITDEALMLEIGTGPPQPRGKHREERPAFSHLRDPGFSEKEQIQRQRMEAAIREKEGEMRERELREREMRERQRERARATSAISDSASRKAKLAADDEPVYVSRNRRRPPPASSSATSSKPSTPEPDLLGGGGGRAASSSLNPFARDVEVERQRSPQPQPRAAPTPRRAPPVQRPTVPISPSALSQSIAARQKGTEAFKRGDYTAAQTFYTSALTPVPETHTLRIIVLSNRSLCTLKLGDPKSAIVDTDEILALIGDSRGESETISLDGAEKDMKDYWFKAVTRKAECLEQMEKWAEAKQTWELALTGGGNQAALNGKRRCEAALKPKAPPKPKATSVKRPSPPPASTKPSGAVTALRQANADQERQEAERLALHDTVHEKIAAWKNGKEGNLRALLAGLDTVLWEGSGWKKVGMGELLMPNKCKIAYMKGIAKVHPDKLAQDATTEQKMISAAVFSLLNDSWDKFKAENGL